MKKTYEIDIITIIKDIIEYHKTIISRDTEQSAKAYVLLFSLYAGIFFGICSLFGFTVDPNVLIFLGSLGGGSIIGNVYEKKYGNGKN